MKKPENPPAFPYNEMDINSPGYVYQQFEGLSMRDYFAAKAMQGLLANPEWMAEYKGEKFIMQKEIIADVSFRIADAMLTEREKNQEQ